MSWLLLLFAGLFEALWVIGVERSHQHSKDYCLLFAAASMAVSLVLFLMSTKTIPVHIAYIVWLGIGVTFIYLYSVFIEQKILSPQQIIFVGLVLIGIIGLKLSGQVGVGKY